MRAKASEGHCATPCAECTQNVMIANIQNNIEK